MIQRPDIPPGQPGHGAPLRWFFGKDAGSQDAYLDEQKLAKALRDAEGWSRPVIRGLRPPTTSEPEEADVVWSAQRGVPEVPSPLVYRGRLYLVRNGGMLKCLDPLTGREWFDERLGAGGQYVASPVAADGCICFGSDSGVMSVVRAGDQLEVLARAHLGDRLTATPALAGSRIYVRTGRWLWAFGPSA